MTRPSQPRPLEAAGRWEVRFDETRLVFGRGEAARLGGLARDLGMRSVLLVTDKGIRGAGHVDRAVRALEAASATVTVFDDVEVNPSSVHVEAGRG